MQNIGSLMVLLGAGSFVLDFLNMEFILLSWVNNWGTGAGYVIRIALIVVGAILWYLGRQSTAKADAPPQA